MKITNKKISAAYFEETPLGKRTITCDYEIPFTRFGLSAEGTFVLDDMPNPEMKKILKSHSWAYARRIHELIGFCLTIGSEEMFKDFLALCEQRHIAALTRWLSPCDYDDLFGYEDESPYLRDIDLIKHYIIYAERENLRSALPSTTSIKRITAKI